MKNSHLVISLGLLAAAALLRFWIAPQALELPSGYTNKYQFTVEDRFRAGSVGEWQAVQVNAWRTDQTLINTEAAIIQADLRWISESDEVIFESSGLYGVDRLTRMNIPAFGNARRKGQFLFPVHMQEKAFTFWDPMFIGARDAVFDHIESLDGMTVYVFHFSGSSMDETEGYAARLDVPERYRVLTDGQGTLWIEPLSGVLVDYQEQGVSYFVDAIYLARVANFHEWSSRYTPETRSAQMVLARTSRTRILLLEMILPAGSSLAAILILALGQYRVNRSERARQ